MRSSPCQSLSNLIKIWPFLSKQILHPLQLAYCTDNFKAGTGFLTIKFPKHRHSPTNIYAIIKYCAPLKAEKEKIKLVNCRNHKKFLHATVCLTLEAKSKNETKSSSYKLCKICLTSKTMFSFSWNLNYRCECWCRIVLFFLWCVNCNQIW